MTPEEGERALILTYALPPERAGLAALLALDDALALLLRTTREPAVGQLRLAWWREALAKLDHAPPPAEPVLQALAAAVLPHGVSGAALVPIVHGWEVLIEEDRIDAAALGRFAEGRGTLFSAAAALGGGTADPVVEAGQGWALADLSRNLGTAEEAGAARALARPLLERAAAHRWSRGGRALGALALVALRDLDLPAGTAPPIGSPRRTARLAWHRLTGR